jgi:lipopolysaccharide biosynthesis glycosyltransferase
MYGVSIKSQNRGAKHDRAIYFCVDAKFHPYALFVANQIATKYPKGTFDFCMISAEPLPHHPLIETHDIRQIEIDAADWGSNLPVDDRISFASYLRIFVPSLLGDDYKRLLYLDADIFYQRGDIDRLLSLDLSGRPVGAIRDMVQLRKPNRVSGDFKPFGLPFAKYFNAGIMLIDTVAWNEQKVTQNALDLVLKNPKKVLQHDQTALNITLRDNWAELSMVWNYLYSHQTMYFSGLFDVCFYHFVGWRKPFSKRYGGFPRRFTEEYRLFFENNFPALAGNAQNGLEVTKHRREHFIALFFHLVNYTRFLPNDDRFASDWDVRLKD